MSQYVKRASNKGFCCWSGSDRVSYVAGVAQMNKYAAGVAQINRSAAVVAQINY
jgi:hypothetical protein